MAFNALTEYATGQSPQDMALAQIDADNQLDLVSIESSRVVIRLGNADGSFGDPIAPASDIAAERVIAGDFTNDCVTDLMTSQWGQLQLHDGNGDGTFQGSQPIGLPWQWELAHTGVALYGQSANSIATGVLNDDGKLDLAVGGTSSFPDGIACGEYSCGYTFSYKGYVNVLLGTGEGSFNYVDADPSDVDPNAHPLGNFQSAAALAIADLDNDGERDVLAAGLTAGCMC